MAPLMSISGLGGASPSFAKGGVGEASFSWKYHMYGSNIGYVLAIGRLGVLAQLMEALSID